ncbi:MAG: hypothetical protein ABSA48_01790 [Terracidiphilus sp.]|jgi:hypothetical protein
MQSKPDGNCKGRDEDEKDESRDFLVAMIILAAIGCVVILLYSLRFWSSGQILRILGVGMLVAGAALLSGFLLGFIFAIPRVGDQKGRTTSARSEGSPAPDSVAFNANLVEISDWLTKIIVGVGLVELHSIPGMLGELSYYLAPGLQPAPCAGGASCAESLISGQAAGLAIVIFYFALGFLLGYVWTMIYFQGDLRRRFEQMRQQKNDLQRLQQAAFQFMPPKVPVILRAEASVSANRLDEALATIDEALNNDPQNGFALMTKARILKRQALQPGQSDSDRERLLNQALVCSDKAIALLPDKGEPIYNKACYQALLDLNRLKDEVLANLESAFRLNPALRQDAKADEDLTSIRHDADFIRLTT